MKEIKDMLGNLEGLDLESLKLAQEELDRKMKPQGSLGMIEKIALKMAGIYGYPVKPVDKKCHIVASADNGVIEEGISSCPIEYTRIVSEAMLNKIACIGLFSKRLGVDFNLIDIGIKEPVPREYPNLYNKNVKRGTNNFYKEPAMTREECLKAIEIGMDMIREKTEGVTVFSNGEMGIGNTTTSSGILYALTKKSLDEVVGRGGGLSDEGLKRKKNLIKESIIKYDLFNKGPLEILRTVGGLDIASMVGLYLGCAKYKKPMLIDGFISGIGALVAVKMEPKVKDYLIATHMSQEPGMKIIMEELNLTPFLNMEMRLGEGTGAVLAYPILKSAMEIPLRMKTKDEVYKIFS